MSERKTNRVYGAVCNRIREIAADGPFTWRSLQGRLAGTSAARDRLRLIAVLTHLVARGELVKVQAARMGRWGKGAVLAAGKLRPVWKRRNERSKTI